MYQNGANAPNWMIWFSCRKIQARQARQNQAFLPQILPSCSAEADSDYAAFGVSASVMRLLARYAWR